MDTGEFRRRAHELADWMADYMETVRDRPVTSDVKPGEIRARLPPSPPESGEPFDRIFADFKDIVLPGMTHWNHPGWFAYFPANTSPPSILAEMLVTTMGAQCMSWQTSPAATELEQVVMGWLGEMVGLPPGFTGVIQDTASTSTLVALLCARERAMRDVPGTGAERLTVYASTECHSSVHRAVRFAGMGMPRFRSIEVDASYAMRPDALERTLDADVAAGFIPVAIVATVGTTSSTAVDPLAPIATIAARHGAWLHVDAAYAGNAAILPERRWIFEGVGGADSLVFNPHKWMLTNFDCSAYFVRDVPSLLATMSLTPEYLRTAHDGEVANFRDWGIQLGRRFRALKLWFVIRSYGVEGLREVLRRHVALAEEFRGWIVVHPDFELLAPGPFGLVCFRWRPAGRSLDEPSLDSMNERLLAAVNASGRVFLTHTRLGERYTLRMSIGQRATTREDVLAAWTLLTETAAALSS